MRIKCGVFLVVKTRLKCKTFRQCRSVKDVRVDCVEGKYRTTSKGLQICPCARNVWRNGGVAPVNLKLSSGFNPLTLNDLYMGRTAPLTSKRCILYIYSTNVCTEYFKHALHSPLFSLQNSVCFIILTCLVPELFTFYIQGVLKLKKNNSGAKGLKCGQLHILSILSPANISPPPPRNNIV